MDQIDKDIYRPLSGNVESIIEKSLEKIEASEEQDKKAIAAALERLEERGEGIELNLIDKFIVKVGPIRIYNAESKRGIPSKEDLKGTNEDQTILVGAFDRQGNQRTIGMIDLDSPTILGSEGNKITRYNMSNEKVDVMGQNAENLERFVLAIIPRNDPKGVYIYNLSNNKALVDVNHWISVRKEEEF